MNILIVDDEPIITVLAQRVLTKRGWQVLTANSLEEARAKPGPFDVIVADVRLPNGDGRHLRELYPDVPFIVISGDAKEHPDLYKPFDPEQLVEKLESVIQKREEG
jgi:DNA-binding response OmpR family regulator